MNPSKWNIMFIYHSFFLLWNLNISTQILVVLPPYPFNISPHDYPRFIWSDKCSLRADKNMKCFLTGSLHLCHLILMELTLILLSTPLIPTTSKFIFHICIHCIHPSFVSLPSPLPGTVLHYRNVRINFNRSLRSEYKIPNIVSASSEEVLRSPPFSNRFQLLACHSEWKMTTLVRWLEIWYLCSGVLAQCKHVGI